LLLHGDLTGVRVRRRRNTAFPELMSAPQRKADAPRSGEA